MAETFEQLRIQMEREFAERGRLDIPRLLREHPAFAREIEEFVLAGIESGPEPEWTEVELRVYNEVMGEGVRMASRDAEMRVSETRVGKRIAALPAPSEPLPEGSARNYARALILAFVVARLYPGDPWLSRVKIQKSLFLLEAALKPGVFTSFEVTAHGLYDKDLRHAADDAERRGVRQRWIEIDKGIKGERPDLFLPGPKAEEAYTRARDQLRDPDLAEAFIDLLVPHSEWVLAAWQTAYEAVLRLLDMGAKTVSGSTVRAYVMSVPDWEETKEGWPEFTESGYEEALDHLERLRLIPDGIVDFG